MRAPPPTVLVADTNASYRAALETTLVSEGRSVRCVGDGLEALKIARSGVGAVFMEIVLPKIDGDRVCRYLKADPSMGPIPVVLMGGAAQELVDRATKARADAYVAKGPMAAFEANVRAILPALTIGSAHPFKAIGLEGLSPRYFVTEILEAKARQDSILNRVGEGILEADELGIVTYVNQAGMKIVARTEEAVVGHPLADLFPDIRTDLEGVFPAHLAGGVGARATRQTNVGDRVFSLRVDSIFDARGFVAHFVVVQDVTEEVRLKDHLRWTAADLERKIADLDRLHRERIQSEKLAAASKLAGGVAHEIKNPLNAMTFTVANLEAWVRELGTLPSAKEASVERYLKLLRTDLDRIRERVDDFMAFSHPREVHLRLSDLNALVEAAVDHHRDRAKSQKISLEARTAPVPKVLIEAGEIDRALSNLLVNAFEATPEGGRVTLSTGVDGEEAWVEVADTGCGITEENRDRIFDLFYSTKPGARGLGLSQVARAVEGHGGRIDLETEPGRGTTFRIRLPLPAQEILAHPPD